MVAPTVKVEGLRDLEKAMFELKTVSAKAAARGTMKKALQPMADHASQLAADDPATAGMDLHRSIAVSSMQASGRRRHRDGPGEVTVFMGVSKDIHDERGGDQRVNYAAAMVNEFGSYKMRPHPFMRPAWTAGKDALLTFIKRDLTKRVAAAVKRARARAAKAR